MALDPNSAIVHDNLGCALHDQKKHDEAIRAYRAAIALDPKRAAAHNNLGVSLKDRGQFDEAIKEFREALALDHKLSHAQSNLADALKWKQLDIRLSGILKGEARPADAEDRLALAWLCQQPFKNLNVASARFYKQAFAEKPQLADGLHSPNRYNAACAAALASGGKGADAEKLGSERSALRKQALDWLRADLKASRQALVTSGDADKSEIALRMQQWLRDTDLAGVRGREVLSKLSNEERESWQSFWEEVEEVRRRATQKTTHAGPR
jgi:tetratricopeptide (TPR) repeat protein